MAIDLGPPDVLWEEQGETAAEKRARCDRALVFLSHWYDAIDGAPEEDELRPRIDAVRAKVEMAERANDPALIYPGKTALARFHEAAMAYGDLRGEVDMASVFDGRSTGEQIIDGIGDTVRDAPAAALGGLADALKNALNAVLKSLWIYLAVAGALVVAYVWFRTRRAAP